MINSIRNNLHYIIPPSAFAAMTAGSAALVYKFAVQCIERQNWTEWNQTAFKAGMVVVLTGAGLLAFSTFKTYLASKIIKPDKAEKTAEEFLRFSKIPTLFEFSVKWKRLWLPAFFDFFFKRKRLIINSEMWNVFLENTIDKQNPVESFKQLQKMGEVSKQFCYFTRKLCTKIINTNPDIPISKFYPNATIDDIIQLVNKDGITHLNLSGSVLDDAALRRISQECKNLTHLNLSECRGVTEAVLLAIAENLTNLTYLDLSECNGVTEAAITAITTRFPNLKVDR